MKHLSRRYWLLLAILLWTGCGNSAPQQETLAGPEDWLPLQVGNATLQVQFAVISAERQQGLMFREELGTEEGMLFVFEDAQRRSFYMKNTPIPLQIGFFRADGELREIRRLFPHDLNSVNSRDPDIQFALEVNPGWFRDNEVRPGAFLNLEDVRDGLRRRGFDPANYGL